MKKIITALCALLLAVTPGFAETAPAKASTAAFTDIPANKIAETLSPGWNLGNQLEGVKLTTDAATGVTTTYPSETGYMATKITNELLVAVKNAGFKFVRIPVSYFAYIDDKNGYAINPEWLARIRQVVDMCVANKLYCMINMHGDGYVSIKNSWLLCAAEDQKPILEKYSAVWKQLAETFKNYNESVMFESMNEEFNGSYDGTNDAAYENINAYNETFVKTIRATGGNNAKRWLLLAGWNTDIDKTVNGFGTPGHFRLPKDARVMVSVHYYDPWGFCGGENGNATQWGSFAGNPEKSNGTEVSMAIQFNKIRDAFTAKGIPVIIGEWGSVDKSSDDPDSIIYRSYFAQKVCENAKRIGAVSVIWDNGWNGKYGAAIFNRGEKADEAGNIKPKTVKVSQPLIIDAIMEAYGISTGKDASGKSLKAIASKAQIRIDQDTLTTLPGATSTLTAAITGGTGKVTWISSDETIAVVKDGTVIATGTGACEITAGLQNGKNAKCAVTVGQAGGTVIKAYLFEGSTWSYVKSAPITIKAGEEKEYEVTFNASSLLLNNIASLYLKDVEVEENHATVSDIPSCPITVESFSINGTSVSLVKNENVEAVNGKNQFDLPLINEWSPEVEMISGFPQKGNRDIASALPALKINKEKNVIVIKFKTMPVTKTALTATAAAKNAQPVASVATALDPEKTYNAYFGIQAADSWVFRNSYGNANYGGDSKEFKNGLFDTENAVEKDGHVRGTITDAKITKADIEAGKTFTVTCTDFSLDDKLVTAKALNVAMISTDIPFGLVEITDAKLFFDGKQVNVNGEGKDLFAVDIDKYSTLITFINIWQTNLKTFGYTIPTQSIKMEFTCKVKD